MKRIYVGNLPFTATEEDVKGLFESHGTVDSINLITDRETGRFRGFAFVEMEEAAADTAIEALNDQDYGGRPLRVNVAKERQPRFGNKNW